MAKVSRKVSRKELLKKDDAFLAAASQSAKWMGGHKLQLILSAVVAIVVVVGTWGIVEHMHARDRDSSAMFARGMMILDKGEVIAPTSEEQPDPDADPPRFATEKDQWTAARAQFQKVIDEGGGGAATLAAFMAADLDEKLGDTAKAEQGFLAAVNEMSPQDSLFFVAVERAAYLQEARGDLDGALRSLARLANAEGGFYKDYASFHQARIYLAKGDEKRARNLLSRIEQEHPDSTLLDRVREQLAALGPDPAAAANEPAKTTPTPAQQPDGQQPQEQP